MMLRTFIQAVVYNYSVLKEEGDEAGVKAKGKVLTKGKDYVVEDGDILLFKFVIFFFPSDSGHITNSFPGSQQGIDGANSPQCFHTGKCGVLCGHVSMNLDRGSTNRAQFIFVRHHPGSDGESSCFLLFIL